MIAVLPIGKRRAEVKEETLKIRNPQDFYTGL